MEANKSRKWFFKFIIGLLCCILAVGGVTVTVDPYFHFHGPVPGISYRLYEERYTNDGIARHFSYDTMIVGTSMNQNFKPSEWDDMMGSKTIKTTFSGGSFLEMGNHIKRAITYNPGLQTILWGIDYDSLIRDYDYDGYGNYPEYLYDNNPWNDVSYVFNKSVLYHGTLNNLFMTVTGQESTTMDEYASWDLGYGMDAILRSYERREEKLESQGGLTEEERQQVTENIQKSFVELADANPEMTFYLFYTPYSILYWDDLERNGMMQKQLEAEEIATPMLLKCPNIKLYDFFDNYELICNTDNYKDKGHYIAEVNSRILRWMYEGKYLVTRENYQERMKEKQKFYTNYDYEGIFAK